MQWREADARRAQTATHHTAAAPCASWNDSAMSVASSGSFHVMMVSERRRVSGRKAQPYSQRQLRHSRGAARWREEGLKGRETGGWVDAGARAAQVGSP